MYRLYIDADARQMDTTARAMHGEYATYAEAVAAARDWVDELLEGSHRPGMTAEALLEVYARRGEEPFILPEKEPDRFDAREYAVARCAAICAKVQGSAPRA